MHRFFTGWKCARGLQVQVAGVRAGLVALLTLETGESAMADELF